MKRGWILLLVIFFVTPIVVLFLALKTARADLIYHEDFEGALSNWSLRTFHVFQETVQWQVVPDGTMVFEGAGGNIWGGGNSIQYLNNVNLSDVSVVAQVKPVDYRTWTHNHWSGIVARYTDEYRYYSFFIYQDSSNLLLQKPNPNGDLYNQITLGSVALPASVFDQWSTLKLDISGNHIQGYLNDTLYVDVYDDSFASGSVGLINAGAITRFDDVFVYSGSPVSAPVPEPATMLLLGSGLVGLAAFRKRFRKN